MLPVSGSACFSLVNDIQIGELDDIPFGYGQALLQATRQNGVSLGFSINLSVSEPKDNLSNTCC